MQIILNQFTDRNQSRSEVNRDCDQTEFVLSFYTRLSAHKSRDFLTFVDVIKADSNRALPIGRIGISAQSYDYCAI